MLYSSLCNFCTIKYLATNEDPRGNLPGTDQVGVISKAQKYSRNNDCEIFQLSHSAEKYPKGFSPKLENSFFSELETSEKTILPFQKNSEKYLVKKVAYCRKTQRETLLAHKTFFTNRKLP